MTAEQTQDDDARIISKYLPEDGEDYIEDSLFTRRELAAYLLAARSSKTWQEAADEMGITVGTYSGKMSNNVKRKKEQAEATMKLIDFVESGAA